MCMCMYVCVYACVLYVLYVCSIDDMLVWTSIIIGENNFQR